MLPHTQSLAEEGDAAGRQEGVWLLRGAGWRDNVLAVTEEANSLQGQAHHRACR